jgi:hypothetical protein
MASLLGGFAGFGGGSIGRASVDLVLNNTLYNEQLAASEAKTKASTTAMGGGFAKFQQSVKSSLTGAQTAFIGLGAVAAIGIAKGIKATQDWAAQIRVLQRVTGESAEKTSALAGAANLLNLDTSKLNTGFGLLSKNIVNNSANLVKYGIATRDASGQIKPFSEVLGLVQDKFNTLPKGAEQTAFAMNVFGRSGKELIPILARGRDGLAELEQKAKDAGLVMSQDAVDASKNLSIAQRELGDAFKGAAIQLGTAFIPVMTVVAEALTKLVELVQLVPKPVLALGAAFVVLGAGVLVAQKAFVALKYSTTEGSLSGLVGILPLLTAIAATAELVAGQIQDATTNFTKMAKQTKINADLLKFLRDRMDLAGSAFEGHSFSGFVASLDGVRDNLQEATDKAQPLIEQMDKLGFSTGSATAILGTYAGELDGSSGSIDQWIHDTGIQIDSIAALAESYGKGQLSLHDFTQDLIGFGINHKDVFFIASAALDKYSEHLDAAGHRVKNFADMTKKELTDWKNTVSDSITSTFLTLQSKTKDIFNVTVKELDKDFQTMLANALRFKTDLAELLALKPGTFGLSKTDLQQFEVFMQQQGPGFVDAFVRASQARQQQWIRDWQQASKAVSQTIAQAVPKDVQRVNVEIHTSIVGPGGGVFQKQLT